MDASAGRILVDGLAAASGVALEQHQLESESESESSSSWVFPLLLSCLAGASTCVGAAVVFCFEPTTIRKSMAFSLSLAAAVMVTISVISILPEVATGIVLFRQDAEAEAISTNNQYDIVLQRTIIRTALLFERLFSLGVGVSAYLLLAKLLVFLPDQEHLYLLDDSGEQEECKRKYDLYLSADDGGNNINIKINNFDDRMERGIETAPNSINSSAFPLVRRRAKRTSNRNATSKQEKSLDREMSHETLSSSGTGSTSFDDTEEQLTALTIERRKRSWRVALMLFSSLLIHNFPEGLCVVRRPLVFSASFFTCFFSCPVLVPMLSHSFVHFYEFP